MKCPEARRNQYALLDNELDVAHNLEILAHLNQCPECARLFNATREFEELVREKELALPIPVGLAERVLARVRTGSAGAESEVPAPAGRVIPFPRRGVALVVAAAVLVALTLAFLQSGGGPAEALVEESVATSEAIRSGAEPFEVASTDSKALYAHLAKKTARGICTSHDLSKAGFTPAGCCTCGVGGTPSAMAAAIQYIAPDAVLTHIVVPGASIPLDPAKVLTKGSGVYSYRWRGHDVLITPCGSDLCVFVIRSDAGVRARLLGCLVH